MKFIFHEHPVQLVGEVQVPYATCTHHAPVPSVAQMVFNTTVLPLVCVALLLIVKLPDTGAFVSRIIDLVADSDSFPSASFHLIYKYFVPFHAGKVYGKDAVHHVQLLG